MSAAKLLRPVPLRLAILAAASGASIHVFTRKSTPVAYDSSAAAASFPQDTSLVSYGRRAQNSRSQTPSAQFSPKRGDAKLVSNTNDHDTYTPGFEDDDQGAWTIFSRNFNYIREGIATLEWASVGDKITDFILPGWARCLPELFQKLQFELSMKPGSLADEIWHEAHDPDINPEILWDARVRVGDTLGKDELLFREKRKAHVVKALAKYLNISEKDIDPEDVPTIAMCSSGGGLRAMIAGASSFLSTRNAGLFDCVTYTSAVSGSCWLQVLFYSTIGRQNHEVLLNHFKSRVSTHIAFPPPALKLVTSAPTNKYILSGFIEKLKGDPTASFGLVDIYSLLLAARLMVPKGDLDVRDQDLKLSNQRMYLEKGELPLPIYTVVRHEIPVEAVEKKKANSDVTTRVKTQQQARQEAWFQWIEMHPYEVWCEEFGAGIPTWAMGRPFQNGRNLLLDTGVALPEVRASLLLGIFGSAFCASLSHYYREVKPLMIGMTGFDGINQLVEGKNDDLIKIHPIDPATIPNFVYGMKDKLPPTCPESVFESDHLKVMDAGMSNNLPIYPLLRPGRDVDILIAFDASADSQRDNWLSEVDGYAKQRGIKSWPIGAGWPKMSAKSEENLEALEEAQASTAREAAIKLAEAKGESLDEKEARDLEANPTAKLESKSRGKYHGYDLGPCNIWCGSKEERESDEEPPPSKLLAWDNPEDTSFQLSKPDAGITVIYFPLIPHPNVPDCDPDRTEFLSTWNFIYTPEEVDRLALLARTNFKEGEDATKRTIRAVYERKKKLRLEREELRSIKNWKKKLRESGDAFTGQ